jgi:outer membrane protein assembly factor BamD
MERMLNLRLLPAGLLVLAIALASCHRHKHADIDLSESAEPDKILYEKSLEDIQNKRYDVARLTLQTLLNTYPDSDHLAQSKLAIADSYFQEGTTGALTHAEVEYKDFITFFPNAPEVTFAQHRAAMCNFRRLEKPDRDRTYAYRAEREFQDLLLNYPDSEYAGDAEKKLLQVQEVLAEGEFRVGRFYYIRQAWRAAASRLADLVERYPNYSRRDQALWMVGRSFEQEIPYFWKADPDRAAEYYARIVREHPLGGYVEDAKESLNRLGQPMPEADPVLLARAQNFEPALSEEEKRGLLGRLFGVFSGNPDTSSAAARLGPPPLEPPREEPAIPPPVLIARNTVSVETAEDLPGGTVQGEAGEAEEGTVEKAGNQQAQAPPKEKKSFWRKLVPFI